ncbi:CE1759 family FMN reductase [Corynebacterium glyciniphilum]|uniref:CE1759 family FMN reductase n=1 Tax=Corynebacterium glyciniphilum TaxID=1404244 RepID=UPI00265546FB|nr:CE1759 family FMN reductase [Corynebacterium glyciniphilum]MDN5682691.1 NAD(P)H-dependent oxidoreductase [Corynebacterium glyciniphilum]MDN6706907.1 NAD(P)H-dependent oxidoreductase [Corynebacterium glyciniphilum]
MSTRKLVVINAGLSNPSSTRDIATRVAYAAEHEVAASGASLEVTVLDLRALAGDLATFMTTMIPTPDLEDARLLVGSADALIAATPVFQGSYAGLFKMFFDTLDKHALQGVPVSLVATAGTPRHSMVLDYAMRPLLSFLQATVLPTGVFVATGEYGESGAEDLGVRITRAGSEIASALGAGRSVGADAAVDGEFGGFEALLRAHSGS